MKKEVKYLSLLYFFETGFQYGVLLLIPFLSKDLHFSITQAGILGGAGNAAKTLLTIPFTSLAMSRGPISSLLLAMALYGLGFIGISFSRSFFTLLFFFILIGIAISIFIPVIFGLTTRFTEKENRGKAIGLVSSMSDLGRIALSAVITFAATQLNWHIASLLAGITTAIVLAYAIWKKPQEIHETEKRKGTLLTATKQLVKNTNFLLSTAVGFFDTIASNSLFLFLPFLMFYRHIALSLMPFLIALFFIGGLTGKIYVGKLTDRFKNTTVFIICEGAMALFLILLANTTNIILFAVLSLILGILTKGTVPASTTMASESVEKEGIFEHAYSFNFLFIALAAMITAPLLGFVADHFTIVNSFYVCALAACIAIIPAGLFHIRRKKASLLANEFVELTP